MKRVLVATGGGDCPGLNAVMRGVVKRASQEKDWEVVGSINAYDGILKEPTEIMVLDDKTVAGKFGTKSGDIAQRGATFCAGSLTIISIM